MGTGIGIIATVSVAVGSELAFVETRKKRNEVGRVMKKDIRFVV